MNRVYFNRRPFGWCSTMKRSTSARTARMGTSKLKPEGWWSRRHRTREAQDAARERYQSDHGRKARQRKAQERLERRET